ncbi:MAG: MFS transporter, partial [Candidatus Hodarchaeales archaeon]
GLAIVITYVDPKKRGRAIGLNSLVVAAALSTGPVVGGILTQHFGWQSIFIINLPIGLVGVIITGKIIKETPKSPAERLDIVGIITFALTMFTMVAGVIYFFKADTLGVILLAISIVSAIIFIHTEFNHTSPMISVRVMKNRKILAGAISSFFSYMSINGTFFLLPFYYQDVLGFDQSYTGMLMIISPIVMSVSGPVTGFLAEKIDAWKLATAGAVLQGFFILILATINPGMSLVSIIILVALGAGSLAIFTNSNGTSVMDAAPKQEISVVSGILNLSRNIAFALGTALSTSMFVLISDFNNPDGFTTGPVWESAYYTGLGTTFALFAVFAMIGAMISISRGRETDRNRTVV